MARKQESVYKIKVLGLNDIKTLNVEIDKLNNNFDGIKKGGNDATNATKSFGVGIGGLTKGAIAATTALVAFSKIAKTVTEQVKKGVEVYKGYEFEMAKVKAITGASDSEFRKLNKTAQELGRSTFFTAQQVASLQLNFSKLGFTSAEVLKVQESALLTATATGEDLARTATVIGSTIRGFGLDAGEGSRVADVMAASFTQSALTLEKFQTSMTKVSSVASLLGFDLEETTAIMGVLTDAGIEASIAGTSLRNIFLKLGDPSSDLAKSIGFTVNSSEDMVREFRRMRDEGVNVEKMLKIVDVRQVQAIANMVKHIDKIEQQTKAYRNSSGAAKEMADIIQNSLQGMVLKFESALDGLRIVLVEKIAPALLSIIDGFSKFFNAIAEATETKLSETLEKDRLKLIETKVALMDANLEHDKRVKLIEQLKLSYPDYLGTINAEKIANDELFTSLEKVNDELANRIILQEHEEKLQKRQALITEDNVKFIKQKKVVEEQIAKVTDKYNLILLDGLDAEAQAINLLQQRPAKYGRLIDPMAELSHQVAELQTLQESLNWHSEKENKLLDEKGKLMFDLGIAHGVVGEFEEIKPYVKPTIQTEGTPAYLEDTTDEIVDEYIANIEEKINESVMKLQQQYIDGIIVTEEQLQEKIFELRLSAYTQENELLFLNFDIKKKLSEEYLKLKVKERSEEQKGFEAAQDGYDKEQLALKNKEEAQIKDIQNTILQAETAQAAISQLLSAKINEILLEAMSSLWADKTIPFLAKVGLAVGMKSLVTPLINNLLSGGGGSSNAGGERFGEQGSQFEQGGLTRGGMFVGNSHANGGVKFRVGGRIHEAEGGEAIINKRSTSMFRPVLSAINSYNGNGVKFADGGLLNSGEKFAMGGELRSAQQLLGGGFGTSKVVIVESDMTDVQNRISAIESQATF